MTPEEAENIYHEAARLEYAKYQADYTPVNQHKVILAGFKAVIDACNDEYTLDMAMAYLNKSDCPM